MKLIYHISLLHTISFTCNLTVPFRHRIVELPWIEFKMRPILFKKSWNLFCSNVVERPAKLAYSLSNSFGYSKNIICRLNLISILPIEHWFSCKKQFQCYCDLFHCSLCCMMPKEQMNLFLYFIGVSVDNLILNFSV